MNSIGLLECIVEQRRESSLSEKISFIVSAHHRPLALRCMLSSLVIQTHDNWEAIVTDRAEDVECAHLHEEFCRIDPRIKYDWNPTRNLYESAERGESLCSGEWLAFPSDDGYYCPWFAERMINAANLNNWELVYCDIVLGGPSLHFLLQQHPHKCAIDKTGFIIKHSWFDGFDSKFENYQESDGIFIEKVVSRGIRHGYLREILCVHN
jgi:glycosyltransferase involved in cell wall biosynthesis